MNEKRYIDLAANCSKVCGCFFKPQKGMNVSLSHSKVCECFFKPGCNGQWMKEIQTMRRTGARCVNVSLSREAGDQCMKRDTDDWANCSMLAVVKLSYSGLCT